MMVLFHTMKECRIATHNQSWTKGRGMDDGNNCDCYWVTNLFADDVPGVPNTGLTYLIMTSMKSIPSYSFSREESGDERHCFLKVTWFLNSSFSPFKAQVLLVPCAFCCLGWSFMRLWRCSKGIFEVSRELYLWGCGNLEKTNLKQLWKNWSHGWLLNCIGKRITFKKSFLAVAMSFIDQVYHCLCEWSL